jgi:hypothetical protein
VLEGGDQKGKNCTLFICPVTIPSKRRLKGVSHEKVLSTNRSLFKSASSAGVLVKILNQALTLKPPKIIQNHIQQGEKMSFFS